MDSSAQNVNFFYSNYQSIDTLLGLTLRYKWSEGSCCSGCWARIGHCVKFTFCQPRILSVTGNPQTFECWYTICVFCISFLVGFRQWRRRRKALCNTSCTYVNGLVFREGCNLVRGQVTTFCMIHPVQFHHYGMFGFRGISSQYGSTTFPKLAGWIDSPNFVVGKDQSKGGQHAATVGPLYLCENLHIVGQSSCHNIGAVPRYGGG